MIRGNTFITSEKKSIRVAIVEANKIQREGLALLINSTFGYQIVSSYGESAALTLNLSADPPDVILAGTDCLSDCTVNSSTQLIRKIKQSAPASKLIILTSTACEKVIFETLKAGADGYLIRSTPAVKLLESIKEVYEGGAPLSPVISRTIVRSFHKNTSSILTPREVQVLELLAKGKTYVSIAEQLYIDKETVRTHLKNIYWKLEVHSKAQAIETALREKII